MYFLRYSIDKIDNVYRMRLDIVLCIDGTCEVVPVFHGVNIPIPTCNIDMDNFVLPGNGTVAGFIDHLGGEIGDSATDIMLQKIGLQVRGLNLIKLCRNIFVKKYFTCNTERYLTVLNCLSII